MTPEQERKLEELIRFMDGIKNAGQLDPEVAYTLGLLLITASSKTATSENRTVNESGTGTYSVLGPPNGFVKIGTYNIPYYT